VGGGRAAFRGFIIPWVPSSHAIVSCLSRPIILSGEFNFNIRSCESSIQMTRTVIFLYRVDDISTWRIDQYRGYSSRAKSAAHVITQ